MVQEPRCVALFYSKPVQNEAKSAEAGRPVCDDVEYVKVFVPGDSSTELDVPATDAHRKQYREEYQAFKEKRSQESAAGTPLSASGLVSPARVEELRLMHVPTVEALANVPDGNLSGMGPGTRTERDKARAYLLAAEGKAPNTKLAAENADLRHRLDVAEENLKQQAARIEALMEKLTAPAEKVDPKAKAKAA